MFLNEIPKDDGIPPKGKETIAQALGDCLVVNNYWTPDAYSVSSTNTRADVITKPHNIILPQEKI